MRILEHAVIEQTDLMTTSQNQYQLQLDTAKLVRILSRPLSNSAGAPSASAL